MTMFSVREQRELTQIATQLRADDSRLCRRLAVREGVLRWAAPGRQDLLAVLVVVGMLAVTLLTCAMTLARCLAAAARAAIFPDIEALMVIGAKSRPAWKAQVPHGSRSGEN